MQIRLENELGSTLWTQQNRIDKEYFLWIYQLLKGLVNSKNQHPPWYLNLELGETTDVDNVVDIRITRKEHPTCVLCGVVLFCQQNKIGSSSKKDSQLRKIPPVVCSQVCGGIFLINDCHLRAQPTTGNVTPV